MGWRFARLICIFGTMLALSSCAEPLAQCAPVIDSSVSARRNDSLEVLAATLSPGVYADTAIYDRLDRDLRTIHAGHPEASDIDYMSPHDGRSLFVEFESFARVRAIAGLYGDWECLNRQYQIESVDTWSRPARIKFKSVYDLGKLAPIYAKLPGVKFAEPNFKLLFEQRKTLCVARRGSDWHFILQRFSDDGNNVLYHFMTTADGFIAQADSWRIPESSVDLEAGQPAWVGEYWSGGSCK